MADQVEQRQALLTAVEAVEAMTQLLTSNGPRTALPGLQAMAEVGREGLSDLNTVASSAKEMHRINGVMGRGFSDIVVNAVDDIDRRRVNEEFDKMREELAAALRAASAE